MDRIDFFKRQAPLLFSIAVTAVYWALSLAAGARDHSTRQLLAWESADFFGHAIELKRALLEEGITAFADRWLHVSGTHTPLVSTVSALIMCVFGETRFAAELALPVFTFALCFSVVHLTRKLYPAARFAPYATAALLLTFPIVVNQSRMYLFEGALAATGAATCWAMAASDLGARRGVMVVFGLMSGLTFVARAMGGMAIAGPVLVFVFLAFRQGNWGRKLVNFTLAGVVAAVIAGPWYLVNWQTLRDYLMRVTYGDLARVHAGTDSAFSLDNAWYSIRWNALDGAGVPILAIALLCYLTACARARRFVKSPKQLALGAAWVISFAILLAGTQRVGAKFFLSVMWIQALAVVRAVNLIETPLPRLAVNASVACLAGFHLWALTFGFSLDAGGRPSPGPFGQAFPLWNHDPHFVSICQAANADPRADYPIAATVDRIAAAVAPRVKRGQVPNVYILSQHPFYNESNARVLARQRRHSWDCPSMGYLPGGLDEFRLDSMRGQLLEADVLVVRPSTGFARDEADETSEILVAPLLSGPAPPFVEEETHLTLPDGSIARFYRRVPDVDWSGLTPTASRPVTFTSPDPSNSETLMLVAWELDKSPSGVVKSASLSFEMASPVKVAPDVVLELRTQSGQIIREVHLDPRARTLLTDPAGPAPWSLRIRFRLQGQVPPGARLRGFAVAVGVTDREGASPWKPDVDSQPGVDATHPRVLLFSPFESPAPASRPR